MHSSGHRDKQHAGWGRHCAATRRDGIARYLAIATVLFGASFSTAQSPDISAPTLNTKPPIKILKRPHRDPGTDQEAAGGFWRTDRNFDALLRIKNILLKQPLEITPVVYMADGTEVDLPKMTVPAAGVVSLNIGRMLQTAGSGAHLSSYGTASVRYKWSWAAVLATIQNTDEFESITFHSTLSTNLTQLKDPETTSSTHTLRGMWWLPHAAPEGFVALTNVTALPLTAQLGLADAANRSIINKSVTLPGHATTLIPLQDLLSGVNDVDATGGLAITYTGAAGSLVANAGIENRAVGYSTTPRVSEVTPAEQASGPVELAAPGVMIGLPDPAMLFPVSTVFSPYAFLQNLSSQQLQVSILAANNGGSRTPLGTVVLPANGTAKVDLTGMIAKVVARLGPESTNLLFSYTGRLGDLGVETGSTDQTNNYVFEVGVNAEVPTISRIICYWTISGDNDTMLDLWNYTDQASDEVLTIQYAGGEYKIPVHLAAGAGATFSVHKLQHAQTPDIDGHLLPLNITEGSALLSSAAGETANMSVAVSAASFNVRNATCGYQCTSCVGVTQFVLNPSPLPLPYQQNGQMSATATYSTGTTQTTTSGTWSSQYTSTASVDNAGLVGGVYPGQSQITLVSSGYPPDAGTVCSDYNPQCPPPAGFAGQAPAQVKPSVTISGPSAMALTGLIQLTATGTPSGGTYSWSASNSNVSLSANGNTVTVSAIAVGSSVVTVTYIVNEIKNVASQTITVEACPTTLNLAQSFTLPLAPLVPNILTGVGIVAQMQVGPSTVDWELTPITESVATVSNSCPVTFAVCSGESNAFYVGSNDAGSNSVDGAPTPAAKNAFYDNHQSTASTNVLAANNISSCQLTCSQTYACRGNQIGPTFSITFSYTLGNVGATAVTNVTTTKTP